MVCTYFPNKMHSSSVKVFSPGNVALTSTELLSEEDSSS